MREERFDGWPAWPQPNDDDLLELALKMAPTVQFLDPAVVREVVEDNRRMRADWSAKLEEFEICPASYLWLGSPCAFPGVRRAAGDEREARPKQAREGTVFPECIWLDDNSYPKHLWAFVFTGKRWGKAGPKGYQFAHLIDHMVHGNRWRDELDLKSGEEEPTYLYGLFTSAANTVYVPDVFLRPTDFSPRLRNLVQERASQLYGGICSIVPPPLQVRRCKDPKWDVDEFPWSEPVGDVDNVPRFLEFRRGEIEKLFDRRRTAGTG